MPLPKHLRERKIIAICQEKALGTYLAEWGNYDYADIIAALKRDENIEDSDGEDCIGVWEPFVYNCTAYPELAELIESEFASCMSLVKACIAINEER